jgi:hypothetical protein
VLLAHNWYQQPGGENVFPSYPFYGDASGPYGHAFQEHLPLAPNLPFAVPIL